MHKYRQRALVVGSVTVALMSSPLAVPSAFGTSGTMHINSDTTLTEDHNGDILIDADNVTLDCDGRVVTGDGSGIGIWLQDRSGVTVKNCEVQLFIDGITLNSSSGNTLAGNNIHNSGGTGVSLFSSNDNTLKDNQADGFQLVADSDGNNLTNNTVVGAGFSFSGSGNTVTGNTASAGEGGFSLGGGSSNNIFTGNTATDHSFGGFDADLTTSANTFTDNTASGNGEDGFHIAGVNNSFTGNRSHHNGWLGFSDETFGGTGDAGTNNSYSSNLCFGNSLGGSSPPGLCLVGDTVGLVDASQGQWHLRNGSGEVTSFFYGNPGDLPISGDWDGDGDSTPGLYRQSDGFFYARNSNNTGIADAECFAGDPSDIPVVGDWDGDGDDNLGIYRPSEQMFYLFTITCTGSPMGAAQISFLFGNPGDKPVAGDWDGDGIDEVGLHRESTGFFYWRNTLDTGIASGETFYGDPGDRFVSGDWGIYDDVDTPAIFRPSDLTFYFRHTLTQGVADSQFVFGESGWLPVSGDFGLG